MAYALSLYEPYATLVVHGYKQLDPRNWATDYRGQLVIHASVRATEQDKLTAWATDPRVDAAIYGLTYRPGALLGTVDLVDIVLTSRLGAQMTPQEAVYAAHGDWADAHYAWVFANPQAFQQPILCKGHRKLWRVPQDRLGQVVWGREGTNTSKPEEDTYARHP